MSRDFPQGWKDVWFRRMASLDGDGVVRYACPLCGRRFDHRDIHYLQGDHVWPYSLFGDTSWACTGAGETLARYLLHSVMMHPHLSLVDISTVATFVLAEVKSWVPGCGGGSELLCFGKKGELSGVGWFDISHVDPFSQAFQQSMKQLFLRACDLEQSDKEIAEHIGMLAMQIEALRNHCKSEHQREGGSLRNLTKALTERKVKKH